MSDRTRRRRRAGFGAGDPVARGDFPAVAAFLRGYLHEDFVEEHGSPTRALEAFLSAVSAEERAAFDAERVRLADRIEGLSIGRLRRLLRDAFGASWSPRSVGEVVALLRSATR